MSRKMIEGFDITSIVNYLRRSRQDVEREKKTGEDTLSEQKKLMDRVLSEYGIPYDQRPEIGSGDKISTRPVFQQVIKDLEDGKYDAIAVKEISRMGRGSYTDMGTIYDLIIEKRIFIITPWKIYDPTNPADLRQIRFELFMSREEFETTRERLNGGRYNSALEGNWVAGPAPFGYDYDSATKKLIINEKEAETVRTIFDFYSNGIILEQGKRKLVQFRALATYLSRVGIKTVTGKDEWAPLTLRSLLTNDRYIGTHRYNAYRQLADGTRVKNPEDEQIVIHENHPAIIDPETWKRTQHRIENRDTTTNTKLDFEPNRLAGLCVCKKCGRKFIRRGSVQRYTKRDGTVSLYDKTMLFCGKTGCTYVRYNAIEEDILETLKYLGELDEMTFERAVNQLIVRKEPKSTAGDLKKYIESKKEDLERRMNFIYEKFESGIYTDDMFLKRKAEIDKEFESLNKVAITDQPQGQEKEIDAKRTKINIKSLLEAYETASSELEKNNLLHSVFDHIDIEIVEKGRGRKPAVHRISPYLKSAFLTTLS